MDKMDIFLFSSLATVSQSSSNLENLVEKEETGPGFSSGSKFALLTFFRGMKWFAFGSAAVCLVRIMLNTTKE